jgi:hypothetical protein
MSFLFKMRSVVVPWKTWRQRGGRWRFRTVASGRHVTDSAAVRPWEARVLAVLRDAEQAQLLAAIDVAVSRCIDAFNIASETDDEELTAEARACVERLKAYRALTASQPARASRWQRARPPRGDSLNLR